MSFEERLVINSGQNARFVDPQLEDIEAIEIAELRNDSKIWNVYYTIIDFSELLKDKFLRTYYILFGVMFPLLMLIGVAFFFGYFMAYFESNGIGGIDRVALLGASPLGEKAANDKAFADMFSSYGEVIEQDIKSRQQIISTSVDCASVALNRTAVPYYDEDKAVTIFAIANMTAYTIAVDECAKDQANNLIVTDNYTTYILEQDLFDDPFFGNTNSPLTFDWTDCDVEEISISRWYNHAAHTFEAWQSSYSIALEQYLRLGYNQSYSSDLALKKASGHTNCGVHLSGGAIYWFAIMTTVRYIFKVPNNRESFRDSHLFYSGGIW